MKNRVLIPATALLCVFAAGCTSKLEKSDSRLPSVSAPPAQPVAHIKLKNCEFLNRPVESKTDYATITSVPGEIAALTNSVGGTSLATMDFIFAHANSRIRYTLPEGKFKTFDFGMGLDDVGKADQGSVIYIVKGDGKELYKSKLVRAMEPPVFASVPVAGVKELELVVSEGPDSMAHDESYWIKPNLH